MKVSSSKFKVFLALLILLPLGAQGQILWYTQSDTLKATISKQWLSFGKLLMNRNGDIYSNGVLVSFAMPGTYSGKYRFTNDTSYFAGDTATFRHLRIGGSGQAWIDSINVVGNYLRSTVGSTSYYAKNDTAALSPDSLIWAKKWWTANKYIENGQATASLGTVTADTLNADRLIIHMSDGTPTIRIHSNNILNTFVGLASGLVNDPSAGGNAALGTYSLQFNTTGACLTSAGAYSLQYNTQGGYNSAFGMAALRQTIAASYNSGFGAYALNANITGANNLALGYRAGQYATNLSNRLYINSLNRTNLLGDTTLSIIYGYQAATAAGQRLYLNANTYISGAVSADSVILSHLKIGGSGSVIDSAKVVGNYLDATVGSVNYFARNDTTSAVSKADSALMPGYATRTQFAADTTYKAALIASKQNTIANLADTSKYVEGGEFAADTLYKASLAATKVAKADSALMPGYATRTQFAADTTYKAAQIATKEPTITAGTTTQYWRGDKSWQTYVPGITGWSTTKRTADTTTSTATLKDVGLAFSVVSGHYYKFKFVLLYSTGATTTGIKVALTCPAVTDFSAGVKIFGFAPDAAAGAWMGVINSSGDVVTSTGVAVINVHYTAEVEGIIVPSADGVLQLQWASETTAAATLKAGSMGEIYEY